MITTIVIWNSGRFPKGISSASLGHGQISVLRNPDIAHLLFLNGYMEMLGRGSVTIRSSCEAFGLPTPIWKDDENGVTLTLFAPEVTTEVKRVLDSINGEMTRKNLQDLLGLRNNEHFRKVYLQPALEAKIIELTIPEKPTSSKQKYRITKLGLVVQKYHQLSK